MAIAACMRKGAGRLLVAGMLLPLHAGTPDESWGNLRKVARDRDYTVQFTDGNCISGRIVAVGPDMLNLQISPERSLVMKRGKVSRVMAFPTADAHDVVFSARTSWEDVLLARPISPEYLEVTTDGGKSVEMRSAIVSKDGIGTAGIFIPKAKIRTVSYVRLTPWTSREMYLLKEDAEFLSPRTWFRYSLMPKISVLLYDAGRPEEGAPQACP